MYQVMAGAARDDAMLPVGQASLLEPLQVVAVPISAALVHTVMAVCHVDEDEGEEAPAASSTTSPHQHLNRAAAGFVVVTNVSMDAQTLTLLAPCSGGLPSCHLLMGKLEWMEQRHTLSFLFALFIHIPASRRRESKTEGPLYRASNSGSRVYGNVSRRVLGPYSRKPNPSDSSSNVLHSGSG